MRNQSEILQFNLTSLYYEVTLPRAEVPRDLDIVRHHCSEYVMRYGEGFMTFHASYSR